MNCKTVQNQLSAYLDSELSGNEMLAMRQHISGCETCQEEEQSLRSLKRMLASTRAPEPSDDLADRLCAAVFAKERKEVRSEKHVVLRTSFLTFAGVAACSMFLTFAVVNGARSSGNPSAAGNLIQPESAKAHDMAFYIQRDQVFDAGSDVTSGVPVLSSMHDVHR